MRGVQDGEQGMKDAIADNVEAITPAITGHEELIMSTENATPNAPVDGIVMRDQQIARDVYDDLFEFLVGVSRRTDSIESQARDLTGRIMKHVKHGRSA